MQWVSDAPLHRAAREVLIVAEMGMSSKAASSISHPRKIYIPAAPPSGGDIVAPKQQDIMKPQSFPRESILRISAPRICRSNAYRMPAWLYGKVLPRPFDRPHHSSPSIRPHNCAAMVEFLSSSNIVPRRPGTGSVQYSGEDCPSRGSTARRASRACHGRQTIDPFEVNWPNLTSSRRQHSCSQRPMSLKGKPHGTS